MRPLFVPLANEPYRRFEAGTKTVEVRQQSGRWNPRQVFSGRSMVLSRGYNTPDRLPCTIGRVAFCDWVNAMPEWAKRGAALGLGGIHLRQARRYFDPYQPVVAFEAAGLILPEPATLQVADDSSPWGPKHRANHAAAMEAGAKDAWPIERRRAQAARMAAIRRVASA